MPGGESALENMVEQVEADLVVNALVGFVGLRPTIAALRRGVPVAIANKETVVTGGEIVLAAAREGGASLIPIDSEHVAIAQCLHGERTGDVAQVILTASGGALRDHDVAEMDSVTVEDVLAHPTWDMGPKITVDSATLVNKGLELIEAHWLFGIPYEKLEVVIHPQSVIHSMVRFVDGSVLAQLGEPDMRVPILYALSHPDRLPSPLCGETVEFPDLTFRPLEAERYPCFRLVTEAARQGGTAPTVLNAANEVAVEAFLDGAIHFSTIPRVIEGALAAVPRRSVGALEDILETDVETRRRVAEQFGLPAAPPARARGGRGTC
jgi:1-deoxy-D-xylulose-5-phosphate reductoisomerase